MELKKEGWDVVGIKDSITLEYNFLGGFCGLITSNNIVLVFGLSYSADIPLVQSFWT